MNNDIKGMKEASLKFGYDIVLLKGCAQHQETSKIFSGLAGDVKFVVKVPSMSCSSRGFADIALDIAEESALLKTLQECPNIIKCADILGLDGYHITVLCNCPMSVVFTRDTFKNISDMHRRHVLVGIAKGILYIQSQGIVHGDISTNNIFFGEIPNFNIDEFSTPLIADFGYAGRVTTPVMEQVVDPDFYTVHHGYGLQAIEGLTLYITDMFRFVLHILLPVFGFHVCKSIISPRKVIVSGVCGPLSLPNASYNDAMNQFMLISEVTRVKHISCIDPFMVPSNVRKFVAEVLRSRVICHAHNKTCYDRIVFTAFEALVRFPRGDVKRSPEPVWSDFIATISDMATWPALQNSPAS